MSWSRSASAPSATGSMPKVAAAAARAPAPAHVGRPRRALGPLGRSLSLPPPQVKEDEPVVRLAPHLLFHQPGVPLDCGPHRLIALPRLDVGEVGQRLEGNMIAVGAAIQ